MCMALKDTVMQYAHGISANDGRATLKFDSLAPCSLVDCVIGRRPAFVLGRQHDASELLAVLLESAMLEEACCRVSARPSDPLPRRNAGLLLLSPVGEGTVLEVFARHWRIPMREFLQVAIGEEDVRLRFAPPALLVALPQLLDGGLEDA